jgi:sugar phosphate isomerase/epimerase
MMAPPMTHRTLNVRNWALPFRIGTTSYIVPDDLLPNAQFLAPHVQDMQLVLFDLPDGRSNLPTPEAVDALAALGTAADLTYTVHLLDDLRLLDGDGRPHPSVASACSLIRRTRGLQPSAWVAHLDGREVRHLHTPLADLEDWWAATVQAVDAVVTCAGTGELLAVENLEGYAPDFVTPVVMQTAAARCVDVGHLWLDGRDPVEQLRAAWSRLRVVHLHGVQGRDHQSLAHAATEQLDAVMRVLLERRFAGVLTLEVFGEDDFWSSLAALEQSLGRIRSEEPQWADN